MLIDEETRRWLLDGDPSVAWQVQRDLLDCAPSTWRKTRSQVAVNGWGARLLSHRASDGTWGGGLYSPKWTSTFYSLRLLTHLGVSPTNSACVASCRLLLDRGVTESGGVALWTARRTDTCVTAMLLSMACYFGQAAEDRVEAMLRFLSSEQMDDGGWNCDWHRKGATHSSFHTTISTLEALRAYEAARGKRRDVVSASRDGREFFLKHQLYRSHRSGKVVKPSFTKFSFPPRWFFDVLRGLEYFASAEAPWDERLGDPITVLLRRRTRDGRWRAQHRHTGKTFFELEPGREASRMNTLRALRVLRWLDRVRPTAV